MLILLILYKYYNKVGNALIRSEIVKMFEHSERINQFPTKNISQLIKLVYTERERKSITWQYAI